MAAQPTSPTPPSPARVSAVWPFVFGLAAFWLWWIAIERYGLGLSIDAITYVSTARNLLEGQGYVDSVQEPFAAWCPMFPTLLASIGLLGVDPLAAAAWVNGLAFALIVGLSAEVLRRHLAAPLLVFLGSALCLAATPLFQASILALSEPTFTLASLGSLLALERWLRSRSSPALALAAIAAALAWSTRYIGLVSLLAGVAILLWDPRSTLRDKLSRCAAFAAIAAAPATLWFVRNHRVTGTWTGGRGAPTQSLLESVVSAFTGVAGWLSADALPHSAWIGAIALATIAAAWLFAQRANRARESTSALAFVPIATYVCAFLALIVVASTSTASVVIPGRLIAPAYVAFVLAALLAIDAGIASLPTRAGRRTGLACATVLALTWLVAQASGVVWTVEYARGKGLPYTEHAWKDVQTIAYLRQNPVRGEVWSNDPWAVYRFTGIHARIAPRPYRAYMPLEQDHGLDAFKTRVAQGGGGWLVWLTITGHSWMHTLPEMQAAVTCELVAEFPDGQLYRLK